MTMVKLKQDRSRKALHPHSLNIQDYAGAGQWSATRRAATAVHLSLSMLMGEQMASLEGEPMLEEARRILQALDAVARGNATPPQPSPEKDGEGVVTGG